MSDTDDLVARMRTCVTLHTAYKLLDEAAVEIERLRKIEALMHAADDRGWEDEEFAERVQHALGTEDIQL